MTDDHGKARISHTDRDGAVERLQEALDAGRIELGEFDERTKAAYGATTKGELERIFDDLPVDRAADRSVHTVDLTDEERERREAAVRERVEAGRGGTGTLARSPALWGLIGVGGLTTAVWALTSAVSGEAGYFWPIWPMLVFAIPLVVRLASRRGR